MLLHELGHLLVATMKGLRFHNLKITVMGFVCEFEGLDKEPGGLLIYAAGPFVNILLAVFAYYYVGFDFFCIANLYLLALNLMPAFPLDGGQILFKVLASRFGILKAHSLVQRLSIVTAISFILLGVLQLKLRYYNMSLLLIGIYILIHLKQNKGEASIMNIKHILYRKFRFLKKGIYPVRHIAVVNSMSMANIISNLDYDRFHIIYFLDENLQIQKILTEQQVIDQLSQESSSLNQVCS